jgi:cysteine desulfurase
MNNIYFDYNASTPVAPEVAEEMRPLISSFYGNPSATHWAGKPVKELLAKARERVASFLSCSPAEIIFTSGGSESNNLALKGYYFKHRSKGNHIITTKIEHPAIMNPCRFLESVGAKVTYVGVDQYGMVSPEEIEKAVTRDTILISVMHANNEVGTLQPIKEIARIARKHGLAFHTDASQSAGKVPLDVEEMQVDMLTIAGHKLYAPKGIGALYIRKGTELEPLIHGAGHEGGLRAGTENTLLAAGLGKACEISDEQMDVPKMKSLTDHFWQQLKNEFRDQVVMNGHPVEVLPNTLNVSFPGKVGQDLLDAIPELAASTGSACHAGMVELSPVLREMQVPEKIGMGTIRFSFGRETTMEEMEHVVRRLKETIQ